MKHTTSSKKKETKKWSAKVNQTSNALDLERDIFKSDNPIVIARSLKHSADKSQRRKTTPYQSAMSMLNFYINRAGSNLSVKHKQTLEKAKNELRKLFDKTVKE